MEFKRTRLRRDYAPLTIITPLEVKSPLSPLNQVFNAELNEYEPDRELTPLVIYPNVQVNAEDGSWTEHQGNKLVANMKWLVNGEDISLSSRFKDKYVITTTGDGRGTIAIMANIPPSERYEIQFEGVISDTRLGKNVPVKSGILKLTTVDKSEDNWAISFDCEDRIQYNPLEDVELVEDYLVSTGKSMGTRNMKSDSETSYKKVIKFFTHKGTNQVEPGYLHSTELFKINPSGTLTNITNSLPAGIEEFSSAGMVLNLRLLPKDDLLVVVYSSTSGNEVARKQISIHKHLPPIKVDLLRTSDINEEDTTVKNKVSVTSRGKVIENPEAFFNIIWKTDSAHSTGVEHGTGEEVTIDLSTTGIGSTYDTGWLDVYVDIEYKD